MIIRNASLDDATAIAEIYEFDLGYKTDINSIGNKLYKYFVAELDDKVVGVIHIEKFETLYYKPIANILSLAVREEYRRREVGKALVDEAAEWTKEKGLDEIRLESSCHRKSAHEFYRAIGFNSEKNQIRFLKKIN